MEGAVRFSKGTRGGPAAACQVRGILGSDGRADDGDGTVMAPERNDGPANTGAGPTRGTSEARRLPFGLTGAMRRACCLCEGESQVGKPLYLSPCACAEKFLHYACMKNQLRRHHERAACPTCKARYPVQRRTKAVWKWFLEDQSREQALMFAATVVFTLGNVGVVAMAWLYLTQEYRPPNALPAALMASALFVVTIFWLGFTCFRIHTMYKPYATWKRANTTFEVVLDEVMDEEV